MTVALAQIEATTDPAANAALVEDGLRRAAAAGAALAVFPEATMCRFGVPLGPVAEPLDGPWATRIADLARATGVHVVAGMFTPAADGRVRNTLLIAAPDGTRAAYDKIHLYDAFGFAESRTVEPGARAVLVDVAGVTVGLSTCYDLRFPALYQGLADAGARVIVAPASWGDGPGKLDAFTTLARARALDSTTYVVAVDQARPSDPEPGTAPRGVGGSLAVGPDGAVLASAGDGPEQIVVDLPLARVDEVRATLPVLANRRDFTVATQG
ncbi:carbon-nitrogen hydrolase family protein [Tsukamurella paurometabola]|uniref:carbon-nitrogen hydrolase family protein n=1 Tax=Tsukamurella paurometabola TaxID=2061 RepID=UPI000F7D90C9|nr:carbon-nitrogen hydrolase family protein [Tsukamurella paurometabola]UEA85637.1 carbon-nitrogen hydrolase family protein [Tsukamurella paurometabola]